MQFTVEDGALDHIPAVELARFIARWGLKLGQDGVIRRKDIGDLTMRELVDLNCHTRKERESFLIETGMQ